MRIESLNVITGANGFIGSHLRTSLLASSGEVLLCRRDGTFTYLSRTKEVSYRNLRIALSELNREKFSLFHCATKFERSNSSGSVESLLEGNFRFPFNLVKDFLNFGDLHLVNLNSYWQALGGSPGKAYSNYATTKNLFLFNLEEILSLDKISNFFLFDTYGPEDYRDKLIPTLLSNLGSDKVLRLSNPNKAMNLSFVSDIVDALIFAGVNEKSGYFDIRHPLVYKLGEIVGIIEDVFGAKVRVEWESIEKLELQTYKMEFASTPDFWNPSIGLKEGIRFLHAKLSS